MKVHQKEKDYQKGRRIKGEGPPEGEEGPPVGEEGPGPEEQVAAREAFDTALAAGASPEEAMAEAAAAAGIEENCQEVQEIFLLEEVH